MKKKLLTSMLTVGMICAVNVASVSAAAPAQNNTVDAESVKSYNYCINDCQYTDADADGYCDNCRNQGTCVQEESDSHAHHGKKYCNYSEDGSCSYNTAGNTSGRNCGRGHGSHRKGHHR